MADIKLNIAKDFSRCPGARCKSEGDFSGEEFRENYLFPQLKEAIITHCKLIVNLDGSAGYSTSFLEEAFGGLIRHNNVSYNVIMATIEIISDEDPSYKDEIMFYLNEANEHKIGKCVEWDRTNIIKVLGIAKAL